MRVNQLRLNEIILRFAKTLFPNLMTVVALCCVLVACDDTNDDDSYVNQKLKVVAIPDFMFKCSDIVLSSTTNTLATRAENETVTLDSGEKLEVKDYVSVRLYVAGDNDQFSLLRNWEETDFRAVMVSVYFHTPTDVAIFMPISAQYFTYNSQRALEVMSMYYLNSIQASNKISKLTSIYGEAAMTCIISSDTVVAKVGYGRIADGTEGVELTVTGVTERAINYLQRTFNDGLKIETWNYFKNTISRDALRDIFNTGATVDFSWRPDVYVNEFSRVSNCAETVYSKLDLETGELTPYKDYGLTEPLDAKYWLRPARIDGTPSKDYIILWHKNEWDCNVRYVGNPYSVVHTNNADIPYDIETKYYELPDNYNVYYFDNEE